MSVKYVFLMLACISMSATNAMGLTDDELDVYANVETVQWLHGAKRCKKDKNPAIQVVQTDASTYVLRQNKCITFEAPFIYVLFGQEVVLVVDTGANESPQKSPLYATIKSLIEQQHKGSLSGVEKVLVVHTHSHSDHTGGDIQFLGQSGVKIVGVEFKDLEQQLGLGGWPDKQGVIDLGGRLIRLIPSTGLIRVKNWAAYKDSIQRLLDFSQQHPLSLILGAHIEFNAEAKKLYSVGQTYQPKEAPLALSLEQLKALNETLKVTKKAKKLIFDSFVISPLNRFERILVNTLSK